MAITSAAIVNQSLELIAAQVQISSMTDGTPAALAASVIYTPVVQMMLRELDPDFARYTAALSLSGAASPVPPWQYEYLYPTDCLRVRQVRPASGGYDVNDPQPVRWNVAFDVISAANTKVILANQVSALCVYTTSTVTEVQWDAAFTDAVVRRLANPLAMALSGRPDFANSVLAQASALASAADATDDGMIVGR